MIEPLLKQVDRASFEVNSDSTVLDALDGEKIKAAVMESIGDPTTYLFFESGASLSIRRGIWEIKNKAETRELLTRLTANLSPYADRFLIYSRLLNPGAFAGESDRVTGVLETIEIEGQQAQQEAKMASGDAHPTEGQQVYTCPQCSIILREEPASPGADIRGLPADDSARCYCRRCNRLYRFFPNGDIYIHNSLGHWQQWEG